MQLRTSRGFEPGPHDITTYVNPHRIVAAPPPRQRGDIRRPFQKCSGSIDPCQFVDVGGTGLRPANHILLLRFSFRLPTSYRGIRFVDAGRIRQPNHRIGREIAFDGGKSNVLIHRRGRITLLTLLGRRLVRVEHQLPPSRALGSSPQFPRNTTVASSIHVQHRTARVIQINAPNGIGAEITTRPRKTIRHTRGHELAERRVESQ